MDSAIVRGLNGFVGEAAWWDGLVQIVASDYLGGVLAALVLFGLWFHGTGEGRLANQLLTISGILGIGFANLVTSLVNSAYFRDRPFVRLELELLFYQPTDSSFPANVVAVGFAVAAAVALRNRSLGVGLAVLAALWGFARVYAGVHYPSDVLAGAALGVGAGLLASAVTHLAAPLIRRVLRLPRAFYLA